MARLPYTAAALPRRCACTRYIYFTRIIVYLMAITLTFKLVRVACGAVMSVCCCATMGAVVSHVVVLYRHGWGLSSRRWRR